MTTPTLRTPAEIRAEIEAVEARAAFLAREIARKEAEIEAHNQERDLLGFGWERRMGRKPTLERELVGAIFRESLIGKPTVTVDHHGNRSEWTVVNVTEKQIHLASPNQYGHESTMKTDRAGQSRHDGHILDLAPVEAFVLAQKAEKKGKK